MSEWQPIETAPTETYVIVCHHAENMWRGSVVIAYSHADYNGKKAFTEDGRCGWRISPPPTHWMPLPEPPK